MEYRLTSKESLTSVANSTHLIRFFGAFALILIVFSGCAGKKNLKSHSSESKTDSIFVEKVVYKQVPVEIIVEKEAECDTITGKVKDFTQTVTSNGNTVTVTSVGGVITTSTTFEGYVSEMIKEHRKNMEIKFERVEVPVEVNKPFKSKWFWYSLILNLILLLYVFRRLIPFLRFIP